MKLRLRPVRSVSPAAPERRRVLRLLAGSALALPAVALAACGSGSGTGAPGRRDSVYQGGGTRGNGNGSNRGSGR
jgi:hypothetical protein